MECAFLSVNSELHDGWWIEGCLLDDTGWAIEDGADDISEATSLYEKPEMAVVPLYLKYPEDLGKMMRTIVAYNGFVFNTNRMVKQYIRNAYEPTIRTKGWQFRTVRLEEREFSALCVIDRIS